MNPNRRPGAELTSPGRFRRCLVNALVHNIHVAFAAPRGAHAPPRVAVGALADRIRKRTVCNALSLFVLALHLSISLPARAHIGSPTVFHDGQAGPYPVHVVIRPPGVVPGIAEITVRVGANGVRRVSVLPVFWRLGTDAG
jgi:hypothetical protein